MDMQWRCGGCHLENACQICPFINDDWANWKPTLDHQTDRERNDQIRRDRAKEEEATYLNGGIPF